MPPPAQGLGPLGRAWAKAMGRHAAGVRKEGRGQVEPNEQGRARRGAPDEKARIHLRTRIAAVVVRIAAKADCSYSQPPLGLQSRWCPPKDLA